jgi:hypothetical protein
MCLRVNALSVHDVTNARVDYRKSGRLGGSRVGGERSAADRDELVAITPTANLTGRRRGKMAGADDRVLLAELVEDLAARFAGLG